MFGLHWMNSRKSRMPSDTSDYELFKRA